MLNPVPKSPPLGIKLVQAGHGMKTTDSDFVFSIETVVGAIFNGSSVEQLFAFHSEIERRLV